MHFALNMRFELIFAMHITNHPREEHNSLWSLSFATILCLCGMQEKILKKKDNHPRIKHSLAYSCSCSFPTEVNIVRLCFSFLLVEKPRILG